MSVSLTNESRLTRLWYDVAFYRVSYSYPEDRPLPVGGDQVYMGNISACDRMEADLVAVPVTGYSDYSGGSVQRSNFRSLLRDYGDSTFVQSYGGYGSEELLLPMEDGEIIMPDDAESDEGSLAR